MNISAKEDLTEVWLVTFSNHRYPDSAGCHAQCSAALAALDNQLFTNIYTISQYFTQARPVMAAKAEDKRLRMEESPYTEFKAPS